MAGAYQTGPELCSAAALQCALHCLGIRVGQQKLANLIGATDDGADEQDLMQAIVKLGLRPVPFESNSRTEARRWLLERAAFHPSILCVDDWNHWVAVAGQCGDRLFLFDSAREVWNTKSRGSWPLKDTTILRRWRASRKKREDEPAYYAIGVMKV